MEDMNMWHNEWSSVSYGEVMAMEEMSSVNERVYVFERPRIQSTIAPGIHGY
jgi:hypothetical protein